MATLQTRLCSQTATTSVCIAMRNAFSALGPMQPTVWHVAISSTRTNALPLALQCIFPTRDEIASPAMSNAPVAALVRKSFPRIGFHICTHPQVLQIWNAPHAKMLFWISPQIPPPSSTAASRAAQPSSLLSHSQSDVLSATESVRAHVRGP